MERKLIIIGIMVSAVIVGALGWRAVTAAQLAATGDIDSGRIVTSADPGYRLMGRGRSVVQVPENWKTNRTKCGTPLADTVVFHSEVVRDCLLMPLDNYSVVEIASYKVTFPSKNTKSSDGFYRKELVSKGDDSRILVISKDKAIFERVVDSYQRLPSDWTTVPDLFIGFSVGTPGVDAVPGESEWSKRLDRFGLKLEINRSGGRPTAEPTVGAPARRGSTVIVTASD